MPERQDIVASESASVPDPASSRLRFAGCLAIAMACMGVIADLLLQYTNNQAHLHDVPAVLADVPVWRLYAGTILGVWVFALASVGVWHASVGLAGSPRLARAFLVTGLLAYAWGAAFHGTFLFAGLLAHSAEIGSPVAHAAALRDAFQAGQVAVGAGSGLMLVVASACYAWAVTSGATAYPRWAVALTPALSYIVLTVIGFVPPLDLIFAPTTFSVMSVIFFTGSTLLLWYPLQPSVAAKRDQSDRRPSCAPTERDE
ncbi:MAG TPA: DUF6796 family protein [Candidatus Dormibacteraeota bacterium]|nr:DUF6796 family protein [Candidatus Dormibacteraeota bacterium]